MPSDSSSATVPPVRQPLAHLEQWVADTPRAMLFGDGMHELSFADAHTFARQLASRLRELGVRPGDRVALEMPMGLQVSFMLAVMHEAAASATYFPELEQSHASVRANSPIFDWLFSVARHSSSTARRTVTVNAEFLQSLSDPDEGFRAHPFASTDLCRIAFSSGTTGRPKPVALTLGMVHNRARDARKLWHFSDSGESTPFMCILDMGTASGFHTFYAALMSGDTYLNPGDAKHNVQLISLFGVTSIKASPIQISLLFEAASAIERSAAVETAPTGDPALSPIAPLVSIYSAGSVVPARLRATVRTQSTARLFNLYGSTEAGRAAEWEIVDDNVAVAGFVAEGTELEIVDDHDNVLPIGQSGAVRYRRAHQAAEYLDDPDTTASAFRDGWFYTGDEGMLSSDGRLTLIGRKSEVFNVGGVKVHPREFEDFAVALGGVSDAAGFGFSAPNGADQFGLALVVDDMVNMRDLSRPFTARFGSRSPVALFAVPVIPRNSMGKIDRRDIARRYEDALAAKSDETTIDALVDDTLVDDATADNAPGAE